MTSLPDWLVERVALDEVPHASRERVKRADPHELEKRVAALRAENTAELDRHPVAAAVVQIEGRIVASAKRRAAQRRRRWLASVGMLGAAAAGLLIVVLVGNPRPADERVGDETAVPTTTPPGDTRVKGTARLLVFRQVGERAERLEQDALVRAGDVVQLRYNAGGQGYGVIVSVDGGGTVTLHHPASEDTPPEATALAPKSTALPHAYELDDAPRFERFFFITADRPIDIQQSLASVRSLARQTDSATASLELPAGLRQWSLRLRKTDRSSTDQQSPTP